MNDVTWLASYVPTILLAVAGAMLGTAALARLTLELRDSAPQRGRLYRVVPGPGAGDPIRLFDTFHGLMPSLWSRLRRSGGRPSISLELVGVGGRAYFRLFIPDRQRGSVMRLLRAAYPGIQLIEEDERSVETPATTRARFILRRQFVPIRVEPRVETLAPLLAVLGEPRRDESIEIQLLARPHPSDWQGQARVEGERLRLGERGFPWQQILGGLRQRPAGHIALSEAQAIEERAQRLPFECVLRVRISTARVERGRELARDVRASLRPFSGLNSLEMQRVTLVALFDRQFQRRQMPLSGRFILTTLELGALWHMPPEPPRHLIATRSIILPPPLDVPTRGRILGVAAADEHGRLVAQAPSDAALHTHIIGATGGGKSTLAANLILQEEQAGRGFGVMDPSRDLIRWLADRISPSNLNRVIVISPQQAQGIIGINPLQVFPDDDPERLADNLLAAIRSVFERYWGPRLEEVLRACLLILVRRPGSTIAHIPLLLQDASFRREVIGAHDDRITGSFWSWWESLTEAQRAEVAAPLLNRLRSFMSLPRVRRLLCQPTSSIDLGKVIANGQILLVDLGSALWGSTAAQLVGSLIFARLWQSAQMRATLPDAGRQPWPLFVDEFPRFLHVSGPFADIVARARALGIPLTLVHQHLGQLPEEVRLAVMQNARTRIVFQCGQDDARTLAREFAPLDATTLLNLPRFHAAVRLAIGGETSAPFTIRTLPLPPPIGASLADELFKASAERFGRPVEEVDTAIAESLGSASIPAVGPAGVGRKVIR